MKYVAKGAIVHLIGIGIIGFGYAGHETIVETFLAAQVGGNSRG